MILLIDNYDSFTYNIFQYLRQLRDDVSVVLNDKITIREIKAAPPAGIVLSPGPGRPEEAGVSMEILKQFSGKIPILGVCLGHQAIGLGNGAAIIQGPQIVHGKTSEIQHQGRGVFRNLPSPFTATRYHSLVIDRESFPHDILEITAETPEGIIMGVRHKIHDNLEGVQFHPESIMSQEGLNLFKNFVDVCLPVESTQESIS